MSTEDHDRSGRKPEGIEAGWGDVKATSKKVDPGADPAHLDHATGVHRKVPLIGLKPASSGMSAHGIDARAVSHVFQIEPRLHTARRTLNANLDCLFEMLASEHGDSVIHNLADVKESFLRDKYIDDPGDNFDLRDKSSGNMTVLSLMCPREGSGRDLYVALEYSENRKTWTLNSWVGKRGNQPPGGRRENIDHNELKSRAIQLLTWLRTQS